MIGYYILIGAIALVSWLVSNTLKRKFEKYSKVQLRNGMSGKEIAEKMLSDNGIYDVEVISTPGQLTDHYNPKNKMMRKDAYKTIDQILRSAPDRDSDTLKGIWTELNATAETDAEKNYMIGGLAMQKYDWAIQLLTPYTKGEDDRIIDYSERAIRKIEKTTKAQPDN